MELEYGKNQLVLIMRPHVADLYNNSLRDLNIRLKESESMRLQGDMRAYETVYRRPAPGAGRPE